MHLKLDLQLSLKMDYISAAPMLHTLNCIYTVVVVWLKYINYIIIIVMNIIVFTILQQQESRSSNWSFNFPSQDNIVLNTQGHNLLNTVTHAGWRIESFAMKIIVPSYTKSPIIMTVERERETVKERGISHNNVHYNLLINKACICYWPMEHKKKRTDLWSYCTS